MTHIDQVWGVALFGGCVLFIAGIVIGSTGPTDEAPGCGLACIGFGAMLTGLALWAFLYVRIA